MGNCGSTYTTTYCTSTTLLDGPLEANPDIVGLGVLAGFGFTALFTFSAIVVGYFTKSLPNGSINAADESFIDAFNNSWLVSRLSKIGSCTISLVSNIFRRNSAEKHREATSKEKKQEMLQRFILALSDQQLVTGIAVLVAGFMARCHISVYEVDVVVSLAWFSSATHLATLDVLQDYLRRNKVVRYCRMVGMVGIVLLLIPGLVISSLLMNYDNILPVECTYTGAYSFEDAGGLNGPQILAIVQIALTVAYLVYGYTTRVIGTFASGDGAPMDATHAFLSFAARGKTFSNDNERYKIIGKAIELRRAADAQKLDVILVAATDQTRTVYERWWSRASSSFTLYSDMFLQRLVLMSFSLSYGVSQVAAYRWVAAPPQLAPASNRMDFGQIVPLVLLVIPILASTEVFFEKSEDSGKDPSTRNSSVSPALGSSDTHSNRQPSGNEMLSPGASALSAVLGQNSRDGDPTEHAEESNTGVFLAVVDHDNHIHRSSKDTHPSTGQDARSDASHLPSTNQYISFLFLYSAVVAIGAGVLLNIGGNPLVAVLLTIILGALLVIVWIVWLIRWQLRLLSIVRIVNTMRDETAATARSSANLDIRGQSMEMRTPPLGSSNSAGPPATAHDGGTASGRVEVPPPVRAVISENQVRPQDPPEGQERERPGDGDAGADEPDFVRPNRQDTEARIGDTSALPSVGITRRATGRT